MTTSFRPVGDATEKPYSAVVSVVVRFSDGSGLRGTGAVVGVNDVLTAAHLLRPPGDGVTVAEIQLTPGLNDGIAPYGSHTASRWRCESVDADGDRMLSQADVARDYALLTVDGPQIAEVTGMFTFAADAGQPGRSLKLSSAGYPAGLQMDPNALDLYRTDGYEYFDGKVIRHNLRDETRKDWSGASGAPFWIEEGRPDGQSTPTIVGLLSTGNWASYITGAVAGQLERWIAENDPRELTGTKERDTLEGGFGDDVIFGLDGGDKLSGKEGADRLHGSKGRDAILGGSGDDVLHGGRGADGMSGGAGDDVIRGGKGSDVINGGPGLDDLYGFRGADTFKFKSGDGAGDVIHDFEPERDIVRLKGGFDRTDVKLANSNDGVTMTFADVRVEFLDVSLGAMQSAEFEFI